jgi:hypothetical protein
MPAQAEIVVRAPHQTMKVRIGVRHSSVARRSLPHDAERVKIILRGCPVNLYICYASAGRTLFAPGDEFLDFSTRAFGYCFHRPVCAISHPTRETKILRFVNGRSAEINALNPAMNRQMGANMVWIRYHWAFFIARRVVLQHGFAAQLRRVFDLTSDQRLL